MRPFDDIDRIARAEILDGPAAMLRDWVQRWTPTRRVKDALHGVWLGHPLHPALAQVPLGAFVSAAVLDATRGGRRGASTLIGFGVMASVPAAAAGAVDYADGHEDQQRTGLVHAAANTAALACYLGSLLARARGRHAAGVALGLAGLGLVTGGATLGGHLGYRQAAGANHGEEIAHLGPASWTDLAALVELPNGAPTHRMLGDLPVLVVRRGEDVTVLSNRCSHLSAPLHSGELTSIDGEDCVVCPWHGSTFRLTDGAVVHGPSTAPQPGFDTRVLDGQVQVRVRAIPGVPAS